VIINEALMVILFMFCEIELVWFGLVSFWLSWCGVDGFVVDVESYGEWICAIVESRFEFMYLMVDGCKVIVWVWVCMVCCFNFGCGMLVFLVSSWWNLMV